MNILYVSTKKRWGGIVSWMQRTAAGLEERGHRVWIITHPDCRFAKSEAEELRLIPRRLGMDFNPAAIWFIGRLIRKHEIQLVVTNIQKELLAGGIAARLCGIPNVRRVGTELDLNDRYKRRQLRLVDHSIIPSDSVLENAMQKVDWLDPKEFTTIYNGRNARSYSAAEIEEERAKWGLFPEDFIIGCTSQLTPSKDVNRLIDVFSRVAHEYADCRLVVTGEGPERPGLEESAARLGIREKVIFAGFTSEPMKTAAAYDIAVCNSSLEGFPNTVVEYFATGRPVIATDVGGTAEMLKDGENGILIDSRSDGQLLRSLLTLIGDQDMRRRLGRNAVETIRSGFSEDLMIERIESLFQRLIAEHGR